MGGTGWGRLEEIAIRNDDHRGGGMEGWVHGWGWGASEGRVQGREGWRVK